MNSKLFSSAATTSHEFMITGDFNILLDDPLDSLPLNNLQTYYNPLTSPNMCLSLLTHKIIHWTSLSLLVLISLQQYHNLLLLYLTTFLYSLTSTLHPHLLHPIINYLPSHLKQGGICSVNQWGWGMKKRGAEGTDRGA